MIIQEDGSYYIISCEKCGAEIRIHKSYCTRYGEAYYFNPELKCSHCGFSAKILDGGRLTSFSPSMSGINKSDDELSCQKNDSAPMKLENQECPWGKSLNDVVLTKGSMAADYFDKGESNNQKDTYDFPELIQKRIDVKVETISAVNSVLNQLMKEKVLHENTKIMIITNFGIVEGTFQEKVDSNDMARRLSIDAAKMRNSHLSELEKEIAVPVIVNNNYFITISDARLIPFANPGNVISFAVMNLFSDQIAGITFGEYRQGNI
jgi:hypothetical protein